jgi:hypothetical protein
MTGSGATGMADKEKTPMPDAYSRDVRKLRSFRTPHQRRKNQAEYLDLQLMLVYSLSMRINSVDKVVNSPRGMLS